MEWIDLIDVEKVCWSLVSQAFGFWLCWIMQAKPAKQELLQLQQVAATKREFRNVLAESEELLERMRKDYPGLLDGSLDGIPKPRGWRYQ
ncbi:MAG TPA: hypothetical protein DDY27_00880 [Hyphomonadaceae bacterium]|nr:hypothetical protein [Hyphomonadaceae bacterium]